MKKTILTSVLTSIMFLFIGNLAFGQSTTPEDGVILEFLPVVNKTKLPAEAANKLQEEIKKHISTWNRLTVVADLPGDPDMKPMVDKTKLVKSPPVDSKPAPTNSPSVLPPTIQQKGNTVASVQITSFKAGSGGAFANPDAAMGKQKAGLRAQIKGVVIFKPKGRDNIVEKVEFMGSHVIASEGQATTKGADIQAPAGSNDKASAQKSSARKSMAGPTKGMKKEVLMQACKRAFADFKNNAKFAFTSDLELKRVLEGRSGDALTVEMVGGNMLDVKEGYHYNIYYMKSTGPKQTAPSMIGDIVVLQNGGTKSIAKIINGSNVIHSMLHGENKKALFATLTPTAE